MEKLYNRIDWHNNTSPAINETNLNRMSKAVDDIDNRVVGIAGTVMETVPQIQEDLAEAQELLEDAEEISTHPPIIGQNGNWWVWDTSIDDYADSGVDAGVSVSVGTTTTLAAGSDATVENVGTATDPILNFGIPQGETGQAGAGVPTGGTTGQVLAKASGTDYDTEWVNASGGSGGHTILNGSGSAMTQRNKLQFEGLNVSDDSGNDKTVVTAPTPDYVDAQYSSSTTYSKGMTCISGNKRYRYINSTASSGHQPPNATYWEVLSVASELSTLEKYVEGEVQIGTYLGVPLYRRVLKTNVTPTQVNETWRYDVEGISLSIAHLISLDGTVEDGNTTSLNTMTLSTMNIALAYFDNNSPSAGVGKFTIRTTQGGVSLVMSSLTAVYTKDNWN